MGQSGPDPRRRVPRTDVTLADPRLVAATATLGRATVKAAVAAAQARARRDLAEARRQLEAEAPEGAASDPFKAGRAH